MPLPEKVIEQLGREPPKTPGWSFGLLLFSGGVFGIALLVYFGLILGYEPYLDGQIKQVNAEIDQFAKSVSADDQAKLVTFYSKLSNLKGVLVNHVTFSRFLSWLEKNTEANIYFSQLTFSSGNQVVLGGIAKAETDVNQQVAIFEAAPEVKSVAVSNITLVAASNLWQFTITLTLDPALLRQLQTP